MKVEEETNMIRIYCKGKRKPLNSLKRSIVIEIDNKWLVLQKRNEDGVRASYFKIEAVREGIQDVSFDEYI